MLHLGHMADEKNVIAWRNALTPKDVVAAQEAKNVRSGALSLAAYQEAVIPAQILYGSLILAQRDKLVESFDGIIDMTTDEWVEARMERIAD